jgi:RNA recognition motif-containing protein
MPQFHTGATAAVTEELEAEGQPGGEFLEDREVFVGNLPSSVNEAQLTELFKQAGSVEIAKVCVLYAFHNQQAIVITFRLFFVFYCTWRR